MSEERDERLGRQIAALPAPDHGPDFWAQLDERLAQETLDELHERRRRRGLSVMLPVVAVAAVIAILIAVVRPAEDEPAHRVDTTPADRSAASELPQMVTGTIEILERPNGTGPLEGTEEYTFARAIDGSYATANAGDGETIAFDAARARQVTWTRFGDGTTSARVDEMTAPGPPDRLPLGYGELYVEKFVVALAQAGDDRVTEVERLGRKAWEYRGDLPVNKLSGEPGPKRVRVTVDEQTGVLLDMEEIDAAGTVSRRLAAREFTVHDSIDRSAFDPSTPAGVEVTTEDGGFRRRELASDDPRVSGWKTVGAWRSLPGRDVGITGPEASNPPSRDVDVVVLQQGWRRAVITSRLSGADESRWDDPFRGEGQVFATKQPWRLLDYNGDLVIDPQTVPHLWGVGLGAVVTVSGPLTSDELQQMAKAAFATCPGASCGS